MPPNNPVLAALHERRSVRKYTGDPVTREELAAILEAGRWAPSGRNNQPWRFLALLPGDPRVEGLAGCTKYSSIVRAGRALVAVFLDRRVMYHEMKDYQGAGACLQNMLLAAHAQGLGGVWLGEIANQADRVCGVLDLDGANYEFMALLVFGRPAQPGNSTRKPMEELLLEPLP